MRSLDCVDSEPFGARGLLAHFPSAGLHANAARHDRRGCQHPVSSTAPGFPAAVSGSCPVLTVKSPEVCVTSLISLFLCWSYREEPSGDSMCSSHPHCVTSPARPCRPLCRIAAGWKQGLLEVLSLPLALEFSPFPGNPAP